MTGGLFLENISKGYLEKLYSSPFESKKVRIFLIQGNVLVDFRPPLQELDEI